MPQYLIDRLQLDTDARVLQSGDEIVPLPPKAIDLLIVLVENAGDVVTRETIRDGVWDGAFVEEANITKNISVLRSVLRGYLNIDPIRTLPKRGYQFVANVRKVPAAAERPAPPTVSPTASEGMRVASVQARAASFELEDNLASAPDPGTGRAHLIWLAIAAVAMLAVTGYVLRKPAASENHTASVPANIPSGAPQPDSMLKPTSLATPRPVLAVLSPANLSGSSADWLGASIREILAADFSATQHLRLISDERSTVAEQDLNLPLRSYDTAALRRIGRRLNCNLVLVGTYKLNGSNIDFDLELRNTTGGEPVAHATQTVTRTGLVSALNHVAENFRNALNVPAAAVVDATEILPLDQGLDSLRPYASGLRALRLYRLGEAQQQLALAVKLSPASALAHIALSRTYSVIGSEDLAGGEAHLALTTSAALPEEQRLEVHAHACSLLSDWPGTIGGYRQLAQLRPDNTDYAISLASALMRSNDTTAATSVLRAAASASPAAATDPVLDRFAARNATASRDADALQAAGQNEVKHARAIDAFTLVSDGLVYLANAQAQKNDIDGATQNYLEAERIAIGLHDSWDQARAMERLGSLQMAQHQTEAAADTYRKLYDLDESFGHTAGAVGALSRLGHLQAASGDFGTARKTLLHSVDLAASIHNNVRQLDGLVELIALSAQQHDLDAQAGFASRTLTLARAVDRSSYIGLAHASLGDVAFARSDIASARDHYNQALKFLPEDTDKSKRQDVLRQLAKLESTVGNVSAAQRLQSSLAKEQLSPPTAPAK